MNKPKFKVGQRYRTAAGNIIEIAEILNEKYVKYELISRKDVGGDHFHINSLYAEELTLVCEKIVITTDGKITTAKMYDGKKLVNSAKAICSPDDEFDFNIGATIALERLTGQLESNLEVEEHFYNGKVVCVKNKDLESYFTVGKIYDIVDGLLKADKKDRQLDNICSIDYLNSIFSGNRLEFLEIVE